MGPLFGIRKANLSCLCSGIGPRKHLEKHGINVVHDLSGVGSELVCLAFVPFLQLKAIVLMLYYMCDYVAIPVAWEVLNSVYLHRLAISPLQGAIEFLKHSFFRGGILSVSIQVLSLFIRGPFLDDDTSSFIRNLYPQGFRERQ